MGGLSVMFQGRGLPAFQKSSLALRIRLSSATKQPFDPMT